MKKGIFFLSVGAVIILGIFFIPGKSGKTKNTGDDISLELKSQKKELNNKIPKEFLSRLYNSQ